MVYPGVVAPGVWGDGFVGATPCPTRCSRVWIVLRYRYLLGLRQFRGRGGLTWFPYHGSEAAATTQLQTACHAKQCRAMCHHDQVPSNSSAASDQTDPKCDVAGQGAVLGAQCAFPRCDVLVKRIEHGVVCWRAIAQPPVRDWATLVVAAGGGATRRTHWRGAEASQKVGVGLARGLLLCAGAESSCCHVRRQHLCDRNCKGILVSGRG